VEGVHEGKHAGRKRKRQGARSHRSPSYSPALKKQAFVKLWSLPVGWENIRFLSILPLLSAEQLSIDAAKIFQNYFTGLLPLLSYLFLSFNPFLIWFELLFCCIRCCPQIL
jgi:hypothetical protein